MPLMRSRISSSPSGSGGAPSGRTALAWPACASASMPTAEQIWPGVQKPHCSASWVTKACCIGCSVSPLAMPSMVVMWRPSCITASVRQALMRRPSTSTVQAPHWPRSQPFLAPVRWRISRSASSSVQRGSSCSVQGLPLTWSVTARVAAPGGAVVLQWAGTLSSDMGEPSVGVPACRRKAPGIPEGCKFSAGQRPRPWRRRRYGYTAAQASKTPRGACRNYAG
ncbi:protein of unknown function (plasmid) [Cupriavidus taiwanensis]|uniref:Uncharacterized protein n=1 Tax=Cupriavidus taiwanensis TaxID=164546 RepID=A0A9Q7XV12_9BURK|nr:protein of unknown function [Cupriavidus taiwanensis]